jgi:hypothetical protein
MHFFAVLLGMVLLFPGLLLAPGVSIPVTEALGVFISATLVVAINATFWIAFLRSTARSQSE